MNLIIYGSILINLLTLVIVVYIYLSSRKEVNKAHKPPTQDTLDRMEASIQQVEYLENRVKQALEQVISHHNLMIQNTTNNLIKYYQDTVTTMTLNYNQNTEKLMQLLDSELKKRVEELDKNAANQIEEARKEVTATVKKDLEQLNVQVDKYSKDRFKQVDEKIYQIVSETAKNSVGKVINLVDHQELVMNSLEAAKKDKFFS
ncbi:MAG TPA: hypothetical protein VLE47_02005 [Candidatus Saccharimonadales bacterium]|nr:hypothetical protein [Candidatus Saccharimonadales bacterium]